MPVGSPPAKLEKLQAGQGRGGTHPPQFGGGDDFRPGEEPSDYERRLFRARLGVLFGMVSIAVLFVTVTIVLILRHANLVFDPQSHSMVREWAPVTLPRRLLLWNSFVLLLSSLTVELARRSIAREMLFAPLRMIAGISAEGRVRVPWLAVTAALGLIFLFGQWLAWEWLRGHGFHVSTVGMSPFFYLLTGAHAVHLIAGVAILCYGGAISLLQRSIERRAIVVEVGAWYWHFMGALWIYIFLLLEFGS